VRRAINVCTVFSLICEPANHLATTAGTKLHKLRNIVESPPPIPPSFDNNANVYMTNAQAIDNLEQNISALCCDMLQTRDLFCAVMIICDRFLINTCQMPQEMEVASCTLREHARMEEAWEARRVDEKLFGPYDLGGTLMLYFVPLCS
jgi:hypothetical protein